MTETSKTHAVPHAKRPFFAHAMRVLAVPIILGWVLIAVVVSTIAPSLEVVGETHSSPMAPKDAPSLKAMMLMGHNFKEFDSNSTVMIVVEGQQKLGPDAHRYYDSILGKLRQDPQHIQHIQDFWGDPLTAAGAQSADAKGAYVMFNLAGEQGTTLANESVEAVRKAVEATPAPPGVKAYVTGPAALTFDQHVVGNASLKKITLFTLVAIAVMLLLVYRSIVTTLVQLFLTGIGLQSSRGFVAVLGDYNIFGLTTFVSNILTMLAIAAATDYGIFIFGRYREARGAGRGSRNRVLHHLSVGWSGDRGFGPDDCRGDVLSELCAAAVLHHDGCTRGDRNARFGGGRDHAGAGCSFRRQPFRSLRSQARGAAASCGAGWAPRWSGGPPRSWSPARSWS